MAQEQWYERDPKRFEDEKVVMADRFPSASLEKLADDSKGWKYSFTSEKGNWYQVLVKYPSNYPSEPPEGLIVKPSINPSKTKHMYNDDSLCLFERDSRAWTRNSTAATALAWVVAWCNAYEVWLETGDWPGDEKEH